MVKDITYCTNNDCPFTDCIRHEKWLENEPPGTIVSISNFGGSCRQYLSYMVGEVTESQMQDGLYIPEDEW